MSTENTLVLIEKCTPEEVESAVCNEIKKYKVSDGFIFIAYGLTEENKMFFTVNAPYEINEFLDPVLIMQNQLKDKKSVLFWDHTDGYTVIRGIEKTKDIYYFDLSEQELWVRKGFEEDLPDLSDFSDDVNYSDKVIKHLCKSDIKWRWDKINIVNSEFIVSNNISTDDMRGQDIYDWSCESISYKVNKD